MSGDRAEKTNKTPNWDALRGGAKPKKAKKKKKKKKRKADAQTSDTPSVDNETVNTGPAVVKPSNLSAGSAIPSQTTQDDGLVVPPPYVAANAAEVEPAAPPTNTENQTAPTSNEEATSQEAITNPTQPTVDTSETGSVHTLENEDPVRVQGKTPLPRVIVVANQKGGVGKTTTTVSLAASVAEAGFRTLVVDLDPQANASTGLGLNPHSLESSVYHTLLHDVAAEDIIEPSEVENLFVLPSSLDLAGAEIELVPAMTREYRLKKAIDSVIDDYDYVFIDCPPSLGLLTINALSAASEVLVPIQCEYYALEGLGQLMNMVELAQRSLNEELRISHIVLVMFDSRTRLGGQVVDEVREHFGDLVCKNVIPRTVRLSEAPSFGQPITVFDPDSTGALAYKAVAEEVIRG